MSDDLKPKVQVCLVMGFPIKNSKSQVMQTAGFKALGIENQFVYLPSEVKPANLKTAVEAIRDLGVKGVSVTMPYKEEVIKYIDALDDDAEEIGAVNTIVNEEGVLTGYNTDWIGAITALEKRSRLEGKRAAVLGAGGAARAIVFGLLRKNAEVKVFNRSLEKGREFSKEFDVEFAGMEDIKEISEYDIIINATSVGMGEEKSPIDKNLINENHLVFDIVYSPVETQLIKDARSAGAVVIYGYEMLLYQGVEQFKMFTGFEAPVREMERGLIESLKQ